MYSIYLPSAYTVENNSVDEEFTWKKTANLLVKR